MPQDKFIALDISLAVRGERHGIANVQRKVWQIFQSNPKLKNLNVKYVCCYGNKDDFRYVEFEKQETKEDSCKEDPKSGNFLYKLLINSVLIYNLAIYFLYFKFIKVLRYKRINKREFLYKLFAKNEINSFNFVFNLFFNKICRFKDRKNKYESIKNKSHNQDANPHYRIGDKIDLQNIEVFISPGAFSGINFKSLFAVKNTNNLKIILVVHDIIPINQPCFFEPCASKHFTENTKILFNQNTDLILTPSTFVLNDILRYCKKNQIRLNATTIKPLLLATNYTLAQASKNDILTNYNLQKNKYAIIVCTVEPRKNHRLLINIWRELYTRNPNDIIPLVIVGGIGWMIGDLINEIKTDIKMKDYIILTDKVDDKTKDALLANARFSLFPSFEEGFGLPIAESLAFGVPCITADNSSLPEAGQGLTEMIDLLDTKKWYETMLKDITDYN